MVHGHSDRANVERPGSLLVTNYKFTVFFLLLHIHYAIRRGFLGGDDCYLLSSRTGCNLFNWVQRHVLRSEQIRSFMAVVRNVAVTTFMELNTVLWTCYLLLLFVYDNALLGGIGTLWPTSLLSVLCSVPFIFFSSDPL